MTKPKTSPCMCCIHFEGGIPCAKGHRPRYYKDKGLRRVCKDFDTTHSAPPPAPGFIESLKRIFGIS